MGAERSQTGDRREARGTLTIHQAFFSSRRAVTLTALFLAILVVLLGFSWNQMRRATTLPDTTDLHLHRSVSDKPGRRVLVINSYHLGYTWSDNEMTGIFEALRLDPKPVEPIVEYLDGKRHSQGGHFPMLSRMLAGKFHRSLPAVVIAADNPALEFALKYRAEIFPDAAIVFCGINGYEPGMIAGQGNITGVAERLNAGDTVALMLRLHPRTREIVMVHDFSVTGLASRRDTEEQIRRFADRVRIRYLPDLANTDLLAEIRRLPPDSLLLVLSYSMDAKGEVFNHEKSAHLLSENSPVPVYALHEERLGHGIVGGYLVGGRSHGAHAARMALRILAGTPAASIPVELQSPSLPRFDHQQLERFAVSADGLPAGSRIVNLPVTFFSRYWALVLSALAIIVTLLAGIALLGYNVFQRKRAQLRLGESERNFKTLVEGSGDALFIEDNRGRLIDVNPEACARSGYPREELLGRDLADLTAPEHRARLVEGRRQVDATGSAQFESAHLDRAGNALPVEVNCRRIEYSGQAATMIDARDIRERKRAEQEQRMLEAQLLQAQKMESVGRLAGGIAHDFNNILTSIIGYCELALQKAGGQPEIQRALQVIFSSSERAARLTQQLLAFSRKQVLEMKPTHLNALVAAMTPMIERLIGEDIRFRFDSRPLPPVVADHGQLEQVVMNLVVNARDAMPEGGSLRIETGPVQSGEDGHPAIPGLNPGMYARIDVTDSGCGMTPEVLDRVFEPFFTTKEKGKGTGLGMATVYGIVRQHNGHVTVASEPGKGTRVSVFLPVAQGLLPEATEADRAAPPGGGSGTVLVVDDDPVIVAMIRSALEAAGYTVLAAVSAEEALVACDRHPGTIDLLLTDVVMPDTNGRDLMASLSPRHPGMATIFMSGYPENLITRRGVLEAGIHYLQKPFSSARLLEAIRQALGRE